MTGSKRISTRNSAIYDIPKAAPVHPQHPKATANSNHYQNSPPPTPSPTSNWGGSFSRWVGPHDQARVLLESYTAQKADLTAFLKRYGTWLDPSDTITVQSVETIQTNTHVSFSPSAIRGAAIFKQLLVQTLTAFDSIQSDLENPTPKTRWWHDPEKFASLVADLQFLTYVTTLDQLIAATQRQRMAIAGNEDLKSATPLTQVVLDEFFSGIASGVEGDTARSVILLKKASDHIQLLATYENEIKRGSKHSQKTLYRAAWVQLKTLTSPLVGVDAPWQGYYAPEYPSDSWQGSAYTLNHPLEFWEFSGYNPSTLPDEHLNGHPLQAAYRALTNGSKADDKARAQTWDAVFKILNRHPPSGEQEIADKMADVTWDAASKKYVRWEGDPWERLQGAITGRAVVLHHAESMVQAAKAYVPPPTSTKAAIEGMAKNISEAKKIVDQMRAAWTGGGIIPSVSIEDKETQSTVLIHEKRLSSVSAQLDQAELAIITADGALRAGDEKHALRHLLRAEREFVLAIQTPRFQSLYKLSGEYQDLSFYTQMGVLVATTIASAGMAEVIAVGTEGAMIAGGYTAMEIQLVRLAASGGMFAWSSANFNSALLNEPMPNGVNGWAYEVASTAFMFGTLEKIALKAGRPLGAKAESAITNSLGRFGERRWAQWIPALGREAAQMGPTYLFFAGAWTPLDMMAQQFVDKATFTPMDVLDKSLFSGQSWLRQLGFLSALGVGNSFISTLIKPLSEPIHTLVQNKVGGRTSTLLTTPIESIYKGYLSRVIETRKQQLIKQREQLMGEWDQFLSAWSANPAAAVQRGIAVTEAFVRAIQMEIDFLSIFMTRVPHITQEVAELRQHQLKYQNKIQEFQNMRAMTAAFEKADFHTLAPELMGYAPAAQAELERLCTLQSTLFSLHKKDNGVFVFEWRGSSGVTESTTTLVPEPTAPLSTGTDMVPVRQSR